MNDREKMKRLMMIHNIMRTLPLSPTRAIEATFDVLDVLAEFDYVAPQAGPAYDEPLAPWERELLHPDGAVGIWCDENIENYQWNDARGKPDEFIPFIRDIRAEFNLGLKVAKDFADNASARKRERLSNEALDTLRQKLTGG